MAHSCSAERVALIDTVPPDANGAGAINLGLEVVRDHFATQHGGCDVYSWEDTIDVSRYGRLAFNIFYPLHLFNAVSFFVRNRLPLRASDRTIPTEAGGQGVSNLRGIATPMFDSIFLGELDGTVEKRYGFLRATELVSRPILRERKANIELTRGCRYRCGFCEYAHVGGGPYREKALDLVIAQIEEVLAQGIRNINLMTINIAGYSQVDALLEFCQSRRVNLMTADIAYQDFQRIVPWLPYVGRGQVRMGVESWDETTRARIRKPISDDDLDAMIRQICEIAGMMHFYVIYGLANDNYEAWLQWVERLAAIRRAFTTPVSTLFGVTHQPTKPLRFEVSMTNFEPCFRTPLAGDPPIREFTEKRSFLQHWVAALRQHGFITRQDGPIVGRFGKGEPSYRTLLLLKHADERAFDALASSFPKGIRKAPAERECWRFIERAERALAES